MFSDISRRIEVNKSKYMLQVNKRHTRARRELFSKLAGYQNDVMDVVQMSVPLTLNALHTLR